MLLHLLLPQRPGVPGSDVAGVRVPGHLVSHRQLQVQHLWLSSAHDMY